MKKIFIPMTVFMFFCIASAGCKYAHAMGIFGTPPSTHVVLLYDVTDAMAARPNSSGIISNLFAFSNNDLYNGYELRIRRLSMVNLTTVFDASVPAQNAFLGDQLQRIGLIKNFKQQVRSSIDNLSQAKVTDEPYSVIYRTVADELNNLSQSKDQNRICIIYSDLIESSKDFWGYSPAGSAEVKNDPQAVINHLQKIEPLDSLQGIVIYVVFKPASYANELQFNSFMNMYRTMWEAKGAKVIVGANLITQ